LNVHGVKDDRQTEIHTAKPLVPEPSATEFEWLLKSQKHRNHQMSDQISAELIKAGYMAVRFEIHKLSNYI
jgi:hypothetical protein